MARGPEAPSWVPSPDPGSLQIVPATGLPWRAAVPRDWSSQADISLVGLRTHLWVSQVVSLWVAISFICSPSFLIQG